MARFLIAAWPYSGHLHPCLALAGRLRARGHETAFYSGATAAGLITRAGYGFFPFQALAGYLAGLVGLEAPDPGVFQALNQRYTTVGESGLAGKWHRVGGLLREMTAGSIGAQIEDLRAICRDWPPDAIIADPMMWAPFVVWHEQTGMPVVPFSFYAGALLPGRRLPVAGLGVAPAGNWAGRLRNNVIDAAAGWLNRPARRQVNQLRQTEGLSPLAGSVPAHSGRLPLYLVASSPEYDFGRDDLPASVHYIGPCLWEPDNNAAHSAAEPQPPAASAGRPIVYVSEGTAQVGEPFLIRAAIAALGNSHLQVVVTTGNQRSQASLGLAGVPANVQIRPWVSHRDLFARTAAVVTTGGSSTVRQALAFGVPVLAVPLEWDQLENGARLEHCGAGIRLTRGQCTAARIRAAVNSLLANPGYRHHASRIQASFERAEQNSGGALERLEALTPTAAAGRVQC